MSPSIMAYLTKSGAVLINIFFFPPAGREERRTNNNVLSRTAVSIFHSIKVWVCLNLPMIQSL